MSNPDQQFAEVFSFPPAEGSREAQDYEAFVESMVPHCHCDPRFRPCDGVLAGGCCDRQLEPDPDDDREEDDAIS